MSVICISGLFVTSGFSLIILSTALTTDSSTPLAFKTFCTLSSCSILSINFSFHRGKEFAFCCIFLIYVPVRLENPDQLPGGTPDAYACAIVLSKFVNCKSSSVYGFIAILSVSIDFSTISILSIWQVIVLFKNLSLL